MKIILTGAQCAGKTTVFELMQRTWVYNENTCQKVSYYPESAIQVINELTQLNIPITQDLLQDKIYEIQSKLEKSLDPFDINILDRGLRDGLAYHPDYYRSLKEEVSLHNYDVVIMLTTLAFDREKYFEEAHKTNRIGTIEDALAQHELLLNVYKDHPRFILLPCYPTLPELAQAIIDKIKELVNIERERKYIVKNFDLDHINCKIEEGWWTSWITTYYFTKSVRVRVSSDCKEGVLTVKTPFLTHERKEINHKLTFGELESVLEGYMFEPLEKTRFEKTYTLEITPLTTQKIKVHFEMFNDYIRAFDEEPCVICEVETLAPWDKVEEFLRNTFEFFTFEPTDLSDYAIWKKINK